MASTHSKSSSITGSKSGSSKNVTASKSSGNVKGSESSSRKSNEKQSDQSSKSKVGAQEKSCKSSNKISSQSKAVESRSSEKSVSSSTAKPSSSKSSEPRSCTEPVSVSGDKQGQANKEFDLSSFMFKQGEIAKQKTISTGTSSSVHKSQVSSELKDNSMSYANSKVMRIDKMLEDCNTKLYCLFLQNVIPVFDIANQLLQKDEPVIHLLHDVMINQLTDIFIRFLKPNTVTSAKSVPEVKFDKIDNQKDDKSLVIGQSARNYIESTSKRKLDVVKFYKDVRKFYCRSCEYMIKTFPFEDKVLIHAKVANIEKRSEAKFGSLKYFTDKFPVLLELSGESIDTLETQFLKYQIDTFSENILKSDRIDAGWHLIGCLKDEATGRSKYGFLVSVMMGILCIFHSNAECERIFSCVNKNKNEFRSNLGTNTLSNLMTHKVYMRSEGKECYKGQHSSELLTKAKSATYNYLNK